MLEQLGPDGMSSDESEGEDFDGQQRYMVFQPRFRSELVTVWLRVFDALHAIRRKTASDKRGAWPRLRVTDVDRYSESTKFVPELPINAYRAEWLAARVSRGDIDFTVRPSPEEFDFSHDQRILE